MTTQQGAWLSLGVAALVLIFKAGAYVLSVSVALLSDAAKLWSTSRWWSRCG